jgi:hypothetical protein
LPIRSSKILQLSNHPGVAAIRSTRILHRVRLSRILQLSDHPGYRRYQIIQNIADVRSYIGYLSYQVIHGAASVTVFGIVEL